MANKALETTKKKASAVIEKLKDDVIYSEVLNVMKDDLSVYEQQPLPHDLHYGTAMVETMKSFMKADFYNLPVGLKCSNCLASCSITRNMNGKRVCISCARGSLHKNAKKNNSDSLFVLPPRTAKPINYILTVQRQSQKAKIPAEALKLLHDFIKTTDSLPNSVGHVKVVLPPIGSVGNGLASYRDLKQSLSDKNGTKYSPLSDVIYIVNSVIRNKKDKVTIVASKMSSITCKPANFIELLNDFNRLNIPSTDIYFNMCSFETKDGSISKKPYSISGEDMLKVFQSKQKLHWISELKLNCFARTFVYGLDTGRNCTKTLEQFLTAEGIIGIQKKIAIIQLEDKEPVEDDIED